MGERQGRPPVHARRGRCLQMASSPCRILWLYHGASVVTAGSLQTNLVHCFALNMRGPVTAAPNKGVFHNTFAQTEESSAWLAPASHCITRGSSGSRTAPCDHNAEPHVCHEGPSCNAACSTLQPEGPPADNGSGLGDVEGSGSDRGALGVADSGKGAGFERGAADQKAIDVGLVGQLPGILVAHRAPVHDAQTCGHILGDLFLHPFPHVMVDLYRSQPALPQRSSHHRMVILAFEHSPISRACRMHCRNRHWMVIWHLNEQQHAEAIQKAHRPSNAEHLDLQIAVCNCGFSPY